MRTLILAAGRHSNWQAEGGVGLKQFIEIDGEPIIKRTFRLASERSDEVFTVVRDPHHRRWSGLNARQAQPENWMHGQSKLLQHRHLWAGEMVLLPGDVYFTEQTLDLIYSYEISQPTIFGRTRTAGQFKRRAEAFGIRFGPDDYDEIERVSRSCVEAGLTDRAGAEWRWFLHRHTGTKRYGGRGLQEVKKVATVENGWVELPHDETEDFDKPGHFETWLKRFRKKGGKEMSQRIATKRIYGIDRNGREVLVAAPGQPVPPGYREVTPTENMAAPKPAATSVEQAKAELAALTVPQLRQLAARKGVDYHGLRKAELIEAIERSS